MTLSTTYDGAALGYNVPPSAISLPARAENGEVSFGSLPVEDPTAALTLTGHRPIYLAESACSQPRLFTGYVTSRDVARSYDQTQFVGADPRVHDATMADANAIFGFRIISGTDGSRPEETWDARLAWILGSDYLVGLHGGSTAWLDSHTNTMDAADYRGAVPSAVFDDLVGRFDGAANYFAFWDPVSAAVQVACFGANSTTSTSTIRISNVASDVDSTVTFAPDQLAKLTRAPDLVYSEVIVEYKGGRVFRSLPPTATTYIRRGTTISRPYTGKSSTAEAQGDEFLRSHNIERDRIGCTIRVPRASVGLVRAGQALDQLPVVWKPDVEEVGLGSEKKVFVELHRTHDSDRG